MSLLVSIRKHLGFKDGGAIFIEKTADGVIIRIVGQAVAKAQAIAKWYTQ